MQANRSSPGVVEFARLRDAALAIASSQAERRVRDRKQGKGKPDPATALIFDRMLAAEKRRISG
jgi:hypothetical protein